ncbi:MAG: DUF6436 domain-containing protein [Fimbriimonadales bacterium]|nr:DUF6436 domain-containing protein [Fimbriimonadales bacterium]
MKPATFVFACWLAGTAFALWHFSVRYAMAVKPPAEWTPPDPRQAPPSPVGKLPTGLRLSGDGPVRVLNFWDPDCACSRFQAESIRSAVRASAGARWVTVVPGGREAAELAEREFPGVPAVADADGRIARAFGVPAAPAAAVLDRRGRLVYVGSYNVARFCDDERTAYAAAAVQSALRGERPEVASVPFFGCGSPAAAAAR